MFKNLPWILAICTMLVKGDELYDTESYGGWIPITTDQAFNLRRPDYHPDSNYDISERNPEDNKYFTDEVLKIVTSSSPLNNYRQVDFVHPETLRNLKVDNVECYTQGPPICSEETDNMKSEVQSTITGQFDIPNKNVRRAKKLVDNDLNTDVDSDRNVYGLIGNGEESTKTKKYGADKIPFESIRKVYEVTESHESTDVKGEESEITKDLGYIYNSPQTYKPNKSNYIDILSKTLLKYNIDTNDRLQNYDLSKQNKNQNSLTPSLKDKPRRFNSMNHLLVDPLLAVFLSNYGHYLPGVYGAEGNYKNLYGYLASNNMHNNRPFGLYKINSDTDSSRYI